MFRLIAGRADQPQDKEKRHHRGHEIGKGYFPGAAVMLLIVAPMALDYENFPVFRVRH